ncbi:GLPGLI family protein [Sediminibacterium roseum]|uniref:GLPGLI family protein n=1 Tax=Sediminibacterium roseum TaxID=1978412 RepID=A0ABW9ZV69_9BACT|nr:GLPGLI family protein [Sediminibacterium roseum]NCI49632.1 GLPGLI family protein [Sediminibacterium roseum]
MKNLAFITLLSALCLNRQNVSAQPTFSETALYKVAYKFIYSYDTTDFSKKSVENMNLYIGPSSSVYRYAEFESYQKESSRMREEYKTMLKTGDRSKPLSHSANFRRSSPTELFKKNMDNKLYRKEVLVGMEYVIEDILPNIKWDILPETKMFGALKGQMAKGRFRGRDYTAWFTIQYPISAGPWKLSGLPGIILEAYDDKKEVVFEFAAFEVAKKEGPTLITLASNYIRIKQTEFDKLQKFAREDIAGFVTSRQAQQGISVTLDGKSLETVYNSKPRSKVEKSPINNKIEKQ